MEKRRIALLGSTGSIGRQALDVISRHRDRFEVELLTANDNYGLLARQALDFGARHAVICNEAHHDALDGLLDGSGTKASAGMAAVCDLVQSDRVDMVLVAVVGFSGLLPTMAAIRADKAIALANKETLVAGGSVVMQAVRERKLPLLPVDSEHSAIFQCLLGAAGNRLSRIHLTASGGPFRTWKREDIARAGKDEALRHPKWKMGAKISIDSATLMNKGFEMIEASWLFDVEPEKIRIVVHPQSIIHSMVEFEDGSVLAQLGSPDMRAPIQFALAYPERLPTDSRRIDFPALGALTFEQPDPERFPCLPLAFAAMERGGNLPCAMNAANEAAVAAYLREEIGFYDIPAIIERGMAGTAFLPRPSLEDLIETDREAHGRAAEIIRKRAR